MTATRIVGTNKESVESKLGSQDSALTQENLPSGSKIRQVALNDINSQTSDSQGIGVTGDTSGGINVVSSRSHKFRNSMIGGLLALGAAGLWYGNRDKTPGPTESAGKSGNVSAEPKPTPLNADETRQALQSLERSNALLPKVSALLDVSAFQNSSLKHYASGVFEAYKTGKMSDAEFKKFRDLLNTGLPTDKDNPWLHSGFSTDMARNYLSGTENKAISADGLDKTDETRLTSLEEALKKLETHLHQHIAEVAKGSKEFSGASINVLGINFLGPFSDDEVNQGAYGEGRIAKDLQLLAPGLIVEIDGNGNLVGLTRTPHIKDGLKNINLGSHLTAGILPISGLSKDAVDFLDTEIRANCLKRPAPDKPTASDSLGMFTKDGRELRFKDLNSPLTFIIFLKPDAFGENGVHDVETYSKNVLRSYPGTNLLYAVVADSREEAMALGEASGYPNINIAWVPSGSTSMKRFPTMLAFDSHGTLRMQATEPTGYNTWFMDTAAKITGK